MMRTLMRVAAGMLLAAGLILAQGGSVAPAGAAAQAKADSIQRASAEKQDSSATQMMVAGIDLSMQREVFSYSMRGRRDPMVSLMNTADIRPLITEVKIISIVYDEQGSNHQAVLLNIVDNKTRYRVKVGQTLGRLRVAQINRQDIVFTINEVGFSRQERLSIKPDTTARRTP